MVGEFGNSVGCEVCVILVGLFFIRWKSQRE